MGYLPRLLPLGVSADTNASRYAELYPSAGTDFSPLDPLQGWTDLIAAGADVGRIKLLTYAGGRISRTDYAMALALGARVGVIDDPQLPADRRFNDPDWGGFKGT